MNRSNTNTNSANEQPAMGYIFNGEFLSRMRQTWGMTAAGQLSSPATAGAPVTLTTDASGLAHLDLVLPVTLGPGTTYLAGQVVPSPGMSPLGPCIVVTDPMPIPQDEAERTAAWMRSWGLLGDISQGDTFKMNDPN